MTEIPHSCANIRATASPLPVRIGVFWVRFDFSRYSGDAAAWQGPPRAFLKPRAERLGA